MIISAEDYQLPSHQIYEQFVDEIQCRDLRPWGQYSYFAFADDVLIGLSTHHPGAFNNAPSELIDIKELEGFEGIEQLATRVNQAIEAQAKHVEARNELSNLRAMIGTYIHEKSSVDAGITRVPEQFRKGIMSYCENLYPEPIVFYQEMLELIDTVFGRPENGEFSDD